MLFVEFVTVILHFLKENKCWYFSYHAEYEINCVVKMKLGTAFSLSSETHGNEWDKIKMSQVSKQCYSLVSSVHI